MSLRHSEATAAQVTGRSIGLAKILTQPEQNKHITAGTHWPSPPQLLISLSGLFTARILAA